MYWHFESNLAISLNRMSILDFCLNTSAITQMNSINYV